MSKPKAHKTAKEQNPLRDIIFYFHMKNPKDILMNSQRIQVIN